MKRAILIYALLTAGCGDGSSGGSPGQSADEAVITDCSNLPIVGSWTYPAFISSLPDHTFVVKSNCEVVDSQCSGNIKLESFVPDPKLGGSFAKLSATGTGDNCPWDQASAAVGRNECKFMSMQMKDSSPGFILSCGTTGSKENFIFGAAQ